MMAKVECWFKQDLKKPVKVQTLNGNVFTLDNVGSLIGVEVYDNGSPATLSGSVNGYIILPDDTTVSVAGTRSGNKVSINLPQSALAIPGFIKIAVKLTNSSEITTLLAVVATVYKSRTDTIITPSQQIITDWSQQIAAEMQAVEDASAAQDAKIDTIKSAISHNNNIENEYIASTSVVGTKTVGSSYYTALPVTLVNGTFYVLEFNIASDSEVSVGLSSSTSASSIVERLCDKAQYKAGTVYLLFKKQSNMSYVRIEVNSATIEGSTLTFASVDTDVLSVGIDKLTTSAFSGIVDIGESMSDMVLLGTVTFTNSSGVQLPTSAVFGKTFFVEFELSETIDDFYMTINQTNSDSTKKKIIFNHQRLVAGKYGFIFYRASDINYIRAQINRGLVASLSCNIYGVDKNNWENRISAFGKLVNSSNYASNLPDIDLANNNTIYIGWVNTNGYPAHMPVAVTGYTTFELLTVKQGNITFQIFYCAGVMYSRFNNGTSWTNWGSFYERVQHYYDVSPSYTDYQYDNDHVQRFSSLALAIEEATKYPNSVIKVRTGTYDILSEYQTLHPDDWATRNDGRGINLNNGLKLIFSSKAVVECKYTGNDTSVLTNFSAFNVRYGDAEIINANIDASRIRYCVHDDMYSSSSPYHVAYRDCIMKIDNSQNPERSTYPHCIGGGFGQNAHIVIENCIFDGIGGDGTVNPAPVDNAIVNWHNGPNASQKSDLFMNGCYFKGNGTFGASSHGTATEVSTLLISGNSFGSPIIDRDLIDVPTQKNIEIIAFNNEVRN